jgi:hypothetical protein
MDITNVKYYIYDQPLQGWKNNTPRDLLWKSFSTETMPEYRKEKIKIEPYRIIVEDLCKTGSKKSTRKRGQTMTVSP